MSSHPDSPSAATPELDPELLRRLERLGRKSGEDLLGQAVAKFDREAVGFLEALRRAAADGDRAALATAAHRLAGGAGVLGGRRVAALCVELERLAGDGPVDAAQLEPLEAALGRLRAALAAYCRALP